jgi:hypothetical protein
MEQHDKHPPSRRLVTFVLTMLVLFAGGRLLLTLQGCAERSDYHPRVVPTVSSTQLVDTEVVPTLDTPLAKAGNAVWCASFQLAWNRAKDDVAGGPLRIANAQEIADRLNRSPLAEDAFPPGSYFAVAGRLEDGIVEKIRAQMARQFPGEPVPGFDGAVGFVTYGFLNTTAVFTTPFADREKSISFHDSDGVARSVAGFGLHEGTDWDLLAKQSAQVRVLFSQADDETNPFRQVAFALDLTADKAEQQVIVAVLPRAANLRATLDDLASRIESFSPEPYSVELRKTDTLAIPNVAINLNHQFAELQGVDKMIENPGEFRGLHIRSAAQSIRFRLDKSGATVTSESHMYVGAVPRRFVVDRPFLVVMKRRSSDEPYFVAWIGNAEFLETN